MARIVTRSRPVKEGNTGMKFSEIVIIALVIGVIAFGARYYMEYRKSAPFALSEFMAAVKAGNAESQYKMISELDREKYFKTLSEYKRLLFPHGYTERIANVVLSAPESDPRDETVVSVKMTTQIRDTTVGKKLYENGSTGSFQDTVKMRKDADGNWRVLLSKSVGGNNKFKFEEATPSPESMF